MRSVSRTFSFTRLATAALGLAIASPGANAAAPLHLFSVKMLWGDFQTGGSYGSVYDMTRFDGVFGGNRAQVASFDALIDAGVKVGGFLILGVGTFARFTLAGVHDDPVNGSQAGYQLIPAAPMAALDLLGKLRLQAHYLRWGTYTQWSAGPSGQKISYETPVGGRLTLTHLGLGGAPKGALRFNASVFFEFTEYHAQSLSGATASDLAAPMRFMTTGATVGFDLP